MLRARAVPVSDAQRARILAATDQVQLDRWLDAAAACASAHDIFGD